MVKLKKSSKRIKPSCKDGIDRISTLPDTLISQILSLLPTENAVATSVLSRRWKFMWTSITSLYFDEKTISSRQKMKRTKFSVFINKMLLLITPLCIQNFHLSCTQKLFDPFHSHLWITVIAPTVQQLDLHLLLFNIRAMELQMNHFHFNKLVVLKLRGCIYFKIPEQASVSFPNLHTLHLSGIALIIASDSSVSFPNLTILHSDYVNYANKESVQKLFSSCPILDDLNISIRHWKADLHCLIICIPSLTRLKINVFGTREVQVDKLCKLKFLSISGHALKVIMTSSANNSSDFHDLKRLDLEVPDCREWCAMINNLLGSMDNLEHLVLRRGDRCSCSQKSWWIEPLNVPSCLLLRVTTISFEQMRDECHDELKLVSYFLKNAEALQQLKLGTQSYNLERKLHLSYQILMVPTRSQSCQVQFA